MPAHSGAKMKGKGKGKAPLRAASAAVNPTRKRKLESDDDTTIDGGGGVGPKTAKAAESKTVSPSKNQLPPFGKRTCCCSRLPHCGIALALILPLARLHLTNAANRGKINMNSVRKAIGEAAASTQIARAEAEHTDTASSSSASSAPARGFGVDDEATAPQGNYHAMCFGTNIYKKTNLQELYTAEKDARDVACALKRRRFRIHDNGAAIAPVCSAEIFKRHVKSFFFSTSIKNGDTAFLYFAGHGEVKQSVNDLQLYTHDGAIGLKVKTVWSISAVFASKASG